MTEQWKDIQGYEGLYQISNLGSVRSIRNDIILKPHVKNGYLAVNLVVNGKTVHKYISTFIDSLLNTTSTIRTS